MVVLKVKTKGILSIKVNHVICIWYVRPHLMETGYSAHFPRLMPTFTDHLIVCWSAMSQTIITFLDFSSFIVGQSNGKAIYECCLQTDRNHMAWNHLGQFLFLECSKECLWTQISSAIIDQPFIEWIQNLEWSFILTKIFSLFYCI